MRLRNLTFGLAMMAGLSVPAAAQGHFTNLEAAIAAAQKDGKDILVDFTGSDWCGWCIRLRKEVFDTKAWTEAAKSLYVFVEIDFPRKKKLSAEARRYNEALSNRFGVRGYPTIFVLDSDGTAYAKTGYKRGGAKAYLRHLAQLANRKDQISPLRAKCSADDKGERLRAVEALLAKYKQWHVAHLQTRLEEQAVDLGSEHSGEYAAQLAEYFATNSNDEKYGKYLEICRKHDPEKAMSIEVETALQRKVLPLANKADWSGALDEVRTILKKAGNSKASQPAYYLAGVLAYRQHDTTACLRYLEKGVSAAPRTQLAGKMKAIVRKLRAAAGPGK